MILFKILLNLTDKMSAKKGAPRGKRTGSGKGKGKKEVEDPILTSLVRTNEELKAKNAELQESVTYYRDKLHTIVQHVLDVQVDDYKPTKGILLVDIPESDVTTMITNLTITPGSSLHAYEVRLEELETRITQISGELAKLLKLKLKSENGLREMERMYSTEELKVQAKRLWYDSCSTQIYISPQNSGENSIKDKPPSVTLSELSSRPTSVLSEVSNRTATTIQQEQEIPPLYLQVLNPRARSINLTPRSGDITLLEVPEKKLPGETHIFDMHSGLRSLIIRHLSKRKGNANDWRLIASRVGIPAALVDQWVRMRAPNAMALVMKVWGDSVGATVRMLHRHLASPQMRSVVLAKRITDFYDVD